MRVLLRETTFQDRRTLEQLRHSDSVEEARWRARVWLNEKRRCALSGRQFSLERRLGDLDPNRQRGNP